MASSCDIDIKCLYRRRFGQNVSKNEEEQRMSTVRFLSHRITDVELEQLVSTFEWHLRWVLQ